jgi:transposase InsO family protein
MLEVGLQAVQADEDVVGTSRVRELERRVRELERQLGRKTMEVELLKEALDVARVKKPSLQLPSWNDRKDGSRQANSKCLARRLTRSIGFERATASVSAHRLHGGNGEIVRVLFAIDACDREVMGWLATSAGISGDMVRDLMVACVERRFGISKAAHPVEWLSDNGSAYIAKDTLDTATALGLKLCFTPVC